MWDEFLQYTKLEVGNGAQIRFWIDIWNGNESLKNRFPDLFRCALNKEGRLQIFDVTSNCHVTFRSNLDDWELSSFCQLIKQLNTCQIYQNREDRLVWVDSKATIFSVINCYIILPSKKNAIKLYCTRTVSIFQIGPGRRFGKPSR